MKALSLLEPVLLILGCTEISYVGEEHLPSSRVDIYYSEDDVKKEYRIIGEAVATGNWTSSFEKLQKDIRTKAMEKGADGVIILDWGHEEKTVWTETTKATDSTLETSVSSSVERTGVKEIRVLLIRYK